MNHPDMPEVLMLLVPLSAALMLIMTDVSIVLNSPVSSKEVYK